MIPPVEYGFMVFWYVVIIAAVVCYAMLDGFDLGVGALYLFVKKDEERRIFLNAIGPVWDGNEVWLVVTVGGLFAGFPYAYATLFSALYIPLTLLISALVFRAVAIEFRSKQPMRWWRSMWDIFFFFGSVMIALAVGIALGNLIEGIPLNEKHEYVGDIVATFIRPYPVLVGILTLSLFMMHGIIYLIMKTEGEIQEKLKKWVLPSMGYFILVYFVTTAITLIYREHMVARIRERPFLFLVAVVDMIAIGAIPYFVYRAKYGWAFLTSCLNIALLLSLFAIGTFPDVVRSSIDPKNNSITIINASASLETLIVLAIIVAIGLPFVFGYGFYIYRLFSGKVKIDSHSY